MPDDHAQDEDAFHPHINLALWRKMLFFARPYRRHLFALSVVAILCASADVILPWLTGRLVDEVTAHGAAARLGRIAAAYFAVITMLGVCILTFIVLAGKIATGVGYDLRAAGL